MTCHRYHARPKTKSKRLPASLAPGSPRHSNAPRFEHQNRTPTVENGAMKPGSRPGPTGRRLRSAAMRSSPAGRASYGRLTGHRRFLLQPYLDQDDATEPGIAKMDEQVSATIEAMDEEAPSGQASFRSLIARLFTIPGVVALSATTVRAEIRIDMMRMGRQTGEGRLLQGTVQPIARETRPQGGYLRRRGLAAHRDLSYVEKWYGPAGSRRQPLRGTFGRDRHQASRRATRQIGVQGRKVALKPMATAAGGNPGRGSTGIAGSRTAPYPRESSSRLEWLRWPGPAPDFQEIDDYQGLRTAVNHASHCTHLMSLSSERGAFARGRWWAVVTDHPINQRSRTGDCDQHRRLLTQLRRR